MPDADLLAAVTEEIGLDPDNPKDLEVGALAARAAGRVLAERLRECSELLPDVPDAAQPRNAFTAAASYVARWCGAEVVESAPSESDRTTSERPR